MEVQENGEQEKFNQGRDMSPNEQVVLLGSSCNYRGVNYNFSEFTKRYREDNLDEDLYRAKGIELPLSDEELYKLQARREGAKLIGSLPFLDENQFKLPGKRQPMVTLIGHIDPDTGIIDHVWRISIVNRLGLEEAPEERKKLIHFLKLNPEHNEFLTMHESDTGTELIMFLNKEVKE